jgi:hypothetical protein
METEMAADLAYMLSVTNVPKILEKIRSAATPPKFTNEFLKTNLGFGASNDRSVIRVLKAMGMLTADGTPTDLYNDFRGPEPGKALAKGLRKAYAPLFLSDERIYDKSGGELLGIVKNTSGAGDSVAQKISSTFKAFGTGADWTASGEAAPEVPSPAESEPEPDREVRQPNPSSDSEPTEQAGVFRLHHDIHIHLPPTSDVSVYRAIFQAMKSELV